MKALFCLLPLMMILTLRIFISRSNRRVDNTATDEYWARERKALYARNKDISGIELFSPDISGLPFSSDTNQADAELLKIEDQVKAASNEPMLDLHELSNAEIKINYGPANFPVISKYDQNYMYYTRDLFKWGKYLYEHKQFENARIVLEYLLTLSDDMSGVYTMLGYIYRDNDEIELISNLIHVAEQSGSITSKSTCNTLRDIINSY